MTCIGLGLFITIANPNTTDKGLPFYQQSNFVFLGTGLALLGVGIAASTMK